MRRLTLALLALFLATDLALLVPVSAASRVSRVKESVSQGLIAEATTLPQNSAGYSQYADNSQDAENFPPDSPRVPGEVSPTDGPDSETFVSQGSIVRGPAPPKEDFPPYAQVVDNSSPKRFKAPGWDIESSNPNSHGRNYRVAKPSERAKPARFRFKIPASDVYSVYAWWPTQGDNNTAARFGISTSSGVKWTRVNQRKDGGFWVKLGAYEMESGDRYAVRVSPASKEAGYVTADAVKIVRGRFASPLTRGVRRASSGTQRLASSSVRSGHPTGLDVVQVARRYIGTPYKHSPPYPCQTHRSEDCSCQTKLVFEKFGIGLPDDPVQQWSAGRWVAKSNLRPGDLVFFKENGPSNPITHVGIYSGQGNLIHASAYFGEVVESKMKYIKGYYGAKRL